MKSLAFAIALFGCLASGAFAQSNRTFVSAGSGSDLNPCSRTSPCRSFGTALLVTNPGGEVIALDSGGYGPFTVSQAASVESPTGVYAGVTVTSGTGILVSAGSGDVVRLTGLTIIGTASTIGVQFSSGLHLIVDQCTLFGSGNGIYMQDPLQLAVLHSSISGSIYGVETRAATGTAQATIDGCTFTGNMNAVDVEQRSLVLLMNSVIEGTSNNGASAASLTADNSVLVIEHCQFAHNHNAVTSNSSVSQGFGTIYISFSAITGSDGTGLSQTNGGFVYSRGNNTIVANSANVAGTIGSFSGQ